MSKTDQREIGKIKATRYAVRSLAKQGSIEPFGGECSSERRNSGGVGSERLPGNEPGNRVILRISRLLIYRFRISRNLLSAEGLPIGPPT